MKTIIFFCDIVGTFTSNHFNRNGKIEIFVKSLNKLIEYEESDKLSFCFITTDNKNILIKHLSEIKPYITGKIILGRQFYCNGYLEDSYDYNYGTNEILKYEQMVSYINELKNKTNINKIYFADDTEFQHLIISELYNYDYPLTQLMPGNSSSIDNIMTSEFYGLDGVNDCINKLSSKKMVLNLHK